MHPTRSAAWRRLTASPAVAGVFDPADVDALPSPARRVLRHALRPGVALASTVVLDMTGELRLRRWLPFRARQVLVAGRGFVWAPRVGRPPLVVTGADTHLDGRGSLAFRLWGLIPVARQPGPETDRSTAGRLAAETVVWLPQALTPAMGATWTAVDDAHATVSVSAGVALRGPTRHGPGRRPVPDAACRHRRHQPEPSRPRRRTARQQLQRQPDELQPRQAAPPRPDPPTRPPQPLRGDRRRPTLRGSSRPNSPNRVVAPLFAADQPNAPAPLRRAFATIDRATGDYPTHAGLTAAA